MERYTAPDDCRGAWADGRGTGDGNPETKAAGRGTVRARHGLRRDGEGGADARSYNVENTFRSGSVTYASK